MSLGLKKLRNVPIIMLNRFGASKLCQKNNKSRFEKESAIVCLNDLKFKSQNLELLWFDTLIWLFR